MYPIAEFPREEVWTCATCQRRDKVEAERSKILQMTVDGKRNQGRPNLIWRELMKWDMARNQMTTDMTYYIKQWHAVIQAGTLRSVEAER